MPNQQDNNDRPALFIPSYPPPPGFGTDTGLVRPVPAGVPYYLSRGIQPLSVFQSGAVFSAEVTIGNWQGGNSSSLAMVSLWWSHALSGTTIPSKSKFIGFASVAVPPHGAEETTQPISGLIEGAVPAHICLLAKVWHALDMAPTTTLGDGSKVDLADPVHDRHWAQHNLATVASSGPQKIQFLATNPGPDEARYTLLLQPMPREAWRSLAQHERMEPVMTRARLALSGEDEQTLAEGVNVLRHDIELKGGEERLMTVSVDLFAPLDDNTCAAFEVQQLKGDIPAGGLAIVLRGGR